MPVEKTNRACKCGSVTHKCTSHKDCPLNKGSRLITPLIPPAPEPMAQQALTH